MHKADDVEILPDEDFCDTDFLADIDPRRVKIFAELIIRECIKQAHDVANLRGVNDDMIHGADTATVKISKHFRVEL